MFNISRFVALICICNIIFLYTANKETTNPKKARSRSASPFEVIRITENKIATVDNTNKNHEEEQGKKNVKDFDIFFTIKNEQTIEQIADKILNTDINLKNNEENIATNQTNIEDQKKNPFYIDESNISIKSFTPHSHSEEKYTKNISLDLLQVTQIHEQLIQQNNKEISSQKTVSSLESLQLSKSSNIKKETKPQKTFWQRIFSCCFRDKEMGK